MSARLPLRTQVLLLLLGTVVVVVLGTALAGTAALRSYLLQGVDDDLRASVRAPGLLLDGPGGGRDPRRRGPRLPRDYLTAVATADGTLRSLDGVPVDADRAPDLADAGRLPERAVTVPARDGSRTWRVLARGLPTEDTVVVALPLDDVEDTVRRLLAINAAVGLLAVLGAGLLGAAGVRRSLRPLVVVEQTAEAIAAGDLSVRVPAADPRTEVGSLSASFNAMVDRFDEAFRAQQASETEARASEARMRRFVGDASHELRTPLTSIRGFAELFRQGAVDDPQTLARVLRRIEDEAARMGLLVEDLLLLARLDQQRPVERAPVDLLAVAADVVHDAAAVHGTHVVRLGPDGPGALVVPGDDARLRQVLGNLVANATAHTPAGTTVEVRLRRDGATAVVEVVDDGPGMAPEVADRVFERFYRADPSRQRGAGTTAGSGLGLSIVAALVSAHGGTVDLASTPGSGTTVTVRLPADR